MIGPHGSPRLVLASIGLCLATACEPLRMPVESTDETPTAERSVALSGVFAAPPTFLIDWISIGAGTGYSCALRSNGSAFCWGRNDRGQLGNGSQVASSMPVPVSGNLTFAHLSVGDTHTCAITAEGNLYCWGGNFSGELGAGLPTGFGSDALSTTPVAVAGGLTFRSVSAGLRQTCGITTGGVSHCWGLNQFGQLGNGVVGGQSAIPVAVQNSDDLAFQVVQTSFRVACGSTADFALHCWGTNVAGQFGNGPPTIPVTAGFPTPLLAGSGQAFPTFDVGAGYVCGLDLDDAAWCWGRNTSGELGTGTIAPSNIPLPVSGGLAFGFLDANTTNTVLDHTCGVTVTAEAYCWGNNQHGQLGSTGATTCTFSAGPTFLTYNCSLSPIPVGGDIAFRSVAVGDDHTCGVAIDGAAYCWGRNNTGQVGDGTLSDRATPTRVQDPQEIAVQDLLGDVVSELNDLAASGEAEGAKLADAASKLGVAIHELTKEPPDAQAAAGNIEGAVGELEAAVRKGFDPVEAVRLMTSLANLTQRLATDAIAVATAGGGDPAEIAEAQGFLADGDALRDAGRYKDAVSKYKDALAKAQGSL